jgi:zinc-ribbon domain
VAFVRKGPATPCPACGAPLRDDERYCRQCGSDRAASPLARWEEPEERTEVIAPEQQPTTMLSRTAAAAPPPATASPPGGTRRRGGARFAVVAGLVVLAAAAGSYAAFRAADSGDDAPPAASGAPSTSPGPSAGTNAPTGPATSRPAPGTSPGLVVAAPALAERPETAEVVALLERYFTAINDKDYAAYRDSLVGGPQRKTEEEFRTDFRSTQDSDVRLLGLRPAGERGLTASISFVSTQDPELAPDGRSACLRWSASFPLVRGEDGVLRIDEVRLSGLVYRRC